MSEAGTKTQGQATPLVETNTALAIGLALGFAIDWGTGLAIGLALGAGSCFPTKLTGRRRDLFNLLLGITVFCLVHIVNHWPEFKAGVIAGFNR